MVYFLYPLSQIPLLLRTQRHSPTLQNTAYIEMSLSDREHLNNNARVNYNTRTC